MFLEAKLWPMEHFDFQLRYATLRQFRADRVTDRVRRDGGDASAIHQ